jgi:hypothetical protein
MSCVQERDGERSSSHGHGAIQRRGRNRKDSMTAAPLLIVGAVGGALNALLSGDSGLLPSLRLLSPGSTRVLRVGVIGNAIVGCGAATGPLWAMGASGFTADTMSWPSFLLLGCLECFMAFVSSRWMTNEADKLVLRNAVVKAAAAPAAHPDAVGEMQVAAPYELYVLVDRLQPRRAGHRKNVCATHPGSSGHRTVAHAADGHHGWEEDLSQIGAVHAASTPPLLR